eukprot:CAMPEP_0181076306 /NCGR_PEP_ID=MMETSP1071-20121207/349_1 /TAXON_ID=35127 /ORGANISM="Thalassiosira sp., Strain NH16" /LENGTH=103 /DNA_ID=CAMNT_0023157479 /DNA_START=146 /DNA_END=458 /DNA_ORIENTATION=-
MDVIQHQQARIGHDQEEREERSPATSRLAQRRHGSGGEVRPDEQYSVAQNDGRAVKFHDASDGSLSESGSSRRHRSSNRPLSNNDAVIQLLLKNASKKANSGG